MTSSPHRFYSLACQQNGVSRKEEEREVTLERMASDGFLTSAQVAERLGVDKAWLVTQAKRNQFPSVAVRRRRGSIVWIHETHLLLVRRIAVAAGQIQDPAGG